MENAVEAGWISNSNNLETWLEDILLYGSGRNDSLFLASSYNAKDFQELSEIDNLVRVFATSLERQIETTAQGDAFCKAVSLWNIDLKNCTYPVALGHASRCQKIPLKLTQTLYLQAFLSNLIAVSQRLLPIGQEAGVRILRNLTPLFPQVAKTTKTGNLSQLSSTTFLSDISSMRHENQEKRIFRT